MGAEDEAEVGLGTGPGGDPTLRLDVLVRGWVQGVGFRVFVARTAQQLSLTGWVRNEPDGAVRAVAEGPRRDLERLLEALEVGPPGARVGGLSRTWPAATGQFERFEIRSGSTPGD
jgi:acylphosphatase